MAHPLSLRPLGYIVSLANAMAWCIRFSLPRANWEGHIMWLIIVENLLFSMPVRILKSAFKRLIFLLSLSSLELLFPGLWAKIMLHVRCDMEGFSFLKISCSTSNKVSPII